MRCRRCSQELPSRADRCLRCFALNPQNVCGPLFAGLDSDPPKEVRVRFDDDAPADLALPRPAGPPARPRKAPPPPMVEPASLPFAGTRMGTSAAPPGGCASSDPPALSQAALASDPPTPPRAILASDPPQPPRAGLASDPPQPRATLARDPPALSQAALASDPSRPPDAATSAPDPLPSPQSAAPGPWSSLFPALLLAWALDLAFVGALALLHVGLAVAVLGPDRLAPGRTGSLDYWVDLLRGGGLSSLWFLLAGVLGIAYAAFFAAIYGRTPGLALARLKRISTGGRRVFGSFARET